MHAGGPELAPERPRGDQLRVLGVMAVGDARVVGEARQRSQLAGCVDAGGRDPTAAVEDRVVRPDPSGHPLDPGPADVPGQAAQRGERKVVVAREAWVRERRIAATDQDQAPVERVSVDPVPGALVKPRLQGCRRAEAVEEGRHREQRYVAHKDVVALNERNRLSRQRARRSRTWIA